MPNLSGSTLLALSVATGLLSIAVAAYYVRRNHRKLASNGRVDRSLLEPLRNIEPLSIPEQKVFNGRPFPLVLAPSNGSYQDPAELIALVRENRAALDRLLLEYKAILFRGFPVEGADGLNSLVEAFDYGNLEYVGGAAVRTQLAPRVFTANEAPSSEKIPFHHEMAQVPRYPTHLFFYGDIPAETGGETPILISSEVCKRLEPLHAETMAKLEETGVRYIRVMPEEDDPSSAIGRSWKSTFLTQNKSEAEAKLQQLGSSYEWLSDGNLRTITATLPAIKMDAGEARTNEKTFFNSMVAAYTGWKDSRNDPEKAVVYGDGSPINAQFIKDASQIMEDICVAFKWTHGDVLLVDNRTVMHARRPFTGKRRVLASLAISPER